MSKSIRVWQRLYVKMESLQHQSMNWDLQIKNFKTPQYWNLLYSAKKPYSLLDDDFLVYHAQWIANGKLHFGIVWGATAKYQNTGAIGIIVRFCTELDALIEGGAGTLQDDIYNRIHYLTE
ncbi:MAG: hypothetical protein Q9P01_06680 [Anaerolineae bacterium]|nr:hypothetical protein [Anaerolineae bacterium]